jgi:hypothetical protein
MPLLDGYLQVPNRHAALLRALGGTLNTPPAATGTDFTAAGEYGYPDVLARLRAKVEQAPGTEYGHMLPLRHDPKGTVWDWAGGLPGVIARGGLDLLAGPRTGGFYTPEGQFSGEAIDIAPIGAAVGVGRAALKGIRPDAATLGSGPYGSRLVPALEALPQEKMAAGQARGVIAKTPGGVSADELEYTGVGKMLEGEGPVTKTALVKQAEENPLEIVDVVKGHKPATWGRIEYLDTNGRYLVHEPGGTRSSYRSRAQAEAALADIQARVGRSDAKFSQWQMPGGENYQETLLTLPVRQVGFPKDVTIRKSPNHDDVWFAQRGDNLVATGKSEEEVRRNVMEGMRVLGEGGAQGEANVFRGGHYDEPNVLAHYRSNERVIDGDRTLHGEEFQDDWFIAASKGAGRQAEEEGLTKGSEPFKKRTSELLRGDWEPLGVPNRPYKKSGTEMAFKRFLRDAADRGMDRVSWTTGKTQADRYDLSKHISEVHYSGTNLKAYGMDGQEVISQTGITREQLPDYIGKEAADRLLSQEPRGTLRSLTGEDLKIGGEWAYKNYDQMRVNDANKFGKKYGVKVEVKHLDNIPRGEIVEQGGGYVLRRSPENFYETRGAAEEALAEMFDVTVEQARSQKQIWSLKLTPEMKRDLLKGGVALGGLGLLGADALENKDRKLGLLNTEGL